MKIAPDGGIVHRIWRFQCPFFNSLITVRIHQVRTLARQHWDDDELHRFMVTHENAAFDLSLCVVDPEAHTTNNAAERPLREPVALRKIRGGLRVAASVLVMLALLACKTT